jgi:hypothetical protein
VDGVHISIHGTTHSPKGVAQKKPVIVVHGGEGENGMGHQVQSSVPITSMHCVMKEALERHKAPTVPEAEWWTVLKTR